MSNDESARPAPGAAGIKAIAVELYGLTLGDARAAAIAAELARLDAGMRAAGHAPIDAAPGAQFRRLLLAGDSADARRA